MRRTPHECANGANERYEFDFHADLAASTRRVHGPAERGVPVWLVVRLLLIGLVKLLLRRGGGPADCRRVGRVNNAFEAPMKMD